MSTFVEYIKWANSLPPAIRREIVLLEAEIQVYRIWCKFTDKHFQRPASERVSREIGRCYFVTKKIPDISVCVFGKCFRLLRGIEFEMVELDCPGEPDKSKMFLCDGQCQYCGRRTRATEKDRPIG